MVEALSGSAIRILQIGESNLRHLCLRSGWIGGGSNDVLCCTLESIQSQFRQSMSCTYRSRDVVRNVFKACVIVGVRIADLLMLPEARLERRLRTICGWTCSEAFRSGNVESATYTHTRISLNIIETNARDSSVDALICL